jgi:hypothetical protein
MVTQKPDVTTARPGLGGIDDRQAQQERDATQSRAPPCPHDGHEYVGRVTDSSDRPF